MSAAPRLRASERDHLLSPLAALASAIERARAELPEAGAVVDVQRRERLENAAGDVLRALVWARRAMGDRELAAIATLDDIALALGTASLVALGYTGAITGPRRSREP